jgi:hypothetical protein
MPIDTQAVARLIAEGKSLHDIARELEGPGDAPTAMELDEMRRRGALGGSSTPPGAEPDVPVNTRMLATFHENQRSGMGRKNAAADAVHVLLEAAANGDPQAVYDPERWQAEHVPVARGGFAR